ncbi:hypothetical protein GCM10009804_25460 [Kribbella hippodromi]|uniref:Uncharacterized protein n=1 Tax=Kribbella hippodromi TaxID=434347 RepID=A0ABN2D1D7_9ACTN
MAAVELRPLPITRSASMLPGVVLIGFGVEWWLDATADVERLGAAALAAVGVTLAIRGNRLGVRCSSKTLTVRGLSSWSDGSHRAAADKPNVPLLEARPRPATTC